MPEMIDTCNLKKGPALYWVLQLTSALQKLSKPAQEYKFFSLQEIKLSFACFAHNPRKHSTLLNSCTTATAHNSILMAILMVKYKIILALIVYSCK